MKEGFQKELQEFMEKWDMQIEIYPTCNDNIEVAIVSKEDEPLSFNSLCVTAKDVKEY